MDLLAYLRTKAGSVLGERASHLEDCLLVQVTRNLINGDTILFEVGDYALVSATPGPDRIAYSPRTNGLAVLAETAFRALPQDMPKPLHEMELRLPGKDATWVPVADYEEAVQHCLSVDRTDSPEWRALLRHGVDHMPIAWIDGQGTVWRHGSGEQLLGAVSGPRP